MIPSLMIIDDAADQLKLMRVVISLVNPNAKVVTAQSGDEALKILKSSLGNLPKLILLDLRMPGKNGIEILSELKADPDLRHIPVCTFSNGALDADVHQAYLAGASFYFRKPSGLEELQRFVQHLFGLWFEYAVFAHV